MYESPIAIIKGAFTTEYENGVMTAVQKYGVNVDKEELIKALNYDREQYRKGFEDGRRGLMKINLNDRIKVKLTDYGKQIYYRMLEDVFYQTGFKSNEPHFPEVDADGYTTFQLWQFINIYGNHMKMTSPEVICPLEIIRVGV